MPVRNLDVWPVVSSLDRLVCLKTTSDCVRVPVRLSGKNGKKQKNIFNKLLHRFHRRRRRHLPRFRRLRHWHRLALARSPLIVVLVGLVFAVAADDAFAPAALLQNGSNCPSTALHEL